MRRIPIVPTLIVVAAAALMVWLGVWQLHRYAFKNDQVVKHHANAHLPPIAWPTMRGGEDRLFYRRATGFCLQVTGWRTIAGRSPKDEPGWSHIATCRTGGVEGPGMQVDIGWSTSSRDPSWKGGAVSGVIVPDRNHGIRLIADQAAPGLEPSMKPTPEDAPNNSFAYAIQWFAFALTALIIYGLALRRRLRPVAPERPNT